jgi:hypothetical protein
MRLSGHYSNPACLIVKLLALLEGREPENLVAPAKEPGFPAPVAGRPTPPKVRWGGIQAAVLIVLGEASGPLRVREVHARVEERLKLKVSYHTVCSFLIAAGKSQLSGVERVRYGTYRTSPWKR